MKRKWQSFFSGCIAFVMTMTTVLMAPVSKKTVYAEAAMAVTAYVNFTAQAYGGFMCAPQQGKEVSSDLAEIYGYTDNVSQSEGVSALDVLVKAHQLIFGDDFTKDTASAYLEMSEGSYGPYISTMFGVETSGVGYILNDERPWTNVNATKVSDGDSLAFWIYQDTLGWSDTSVKTWIKDDEISAFNFTENEPKTICVMTNRGYGTEGPVSGAKVAVVDEGGGLSDIDGAVTNDLGEATLQFIKDGNYNITVYTDFQNDSSKTPVIMTIIPVTVIKGSISSNIIKDADSLPEIIQEGETYVLGDDITLNAGQQISDVKGILDGQGHTIMLSDKPLADKVSGTIQNLGVIGSQTINMSSAFGTMAVNLSGSIVNCYAAADINTSGWDDIGGIAGTLEGGTISNTYFGGTSSAMFADGLVGTAKGGRVSNCISTIGWSMAGINNPKPEVVNYNKLSASALKTEDAVSKLNKDIASTGYKFALPEDGSNNGMPVLVKDSGEIQVDKAALNEAINNAEALNKDEFTEDSWKVLESAIENAKKISESSSASQTEVDNACDGLKAAIDSLIKKDITEPVAKPQDESRITHIKSQADIDSIDFSDKSAFYVLDNDITIDKNYWQFSNLAGVFDGQGHTVALDSPSTALFANVEKTGIVQNVHFTGISTSGMMFGPLGYSMKGTVVNCYTDVAGDNACGFSKTLDGGQVINSCSISTAKQGVLFNQYKSGKMIHTYWSSEGKNPIKTSIPSDALIDSEEKQPKEMRTIEFTELLNKYRGENGTEWGQGNNGYPYFGEDKEYSEGDISLPENKYEVEFTPWNSSDKADVDSQNITVAKNDCNEFGFYGTFSLKNVPGIAKVTWTLQNTAPDKCLLVGEEDGTLYIKSDGSALLTASIVKEDGTIETAASINVRAVSKTIKDIKLYIEDKEVNDACTVEGSKWEEIKVKALYEGEEEYVDAVSTLFSFTADNEDYIKNMGYDSFYFKKPGTADMTVSVKGNPGITKTISITSNYVPVTSVKPAISGTRVLHGRNANSENSEKFIPEICTVTVEPENASYRENFEIVSSNPEVGNYVGSMILGYVPNKAGTTTYTATIEDISPDGTKNIVSGSSMVTYVYKNPLTNIKVNEPSIEMENSTSQKLDITFEGALSGEGYSITEPKLIWTYDKAGVVKIEQSRGGWKRDESAPDNNLYLPGAEYTVYAQGEGTVTATGTPLDNTNGLKPVKITITVTNGNDMAADIDGIVSKGINGAIKYLNSKHDGKYVYGEEWTVYTLLRAGQAISDKELNDYYNSVAEKVKTWNSNRKPTDIERVALALSIMGRNIEDVGGVNLAEMIYNSDSLSDGSNELIYALLALDAKNTVIPEDAKWNRKSIINELLKFQNENGGFGLFSSNVVSLDMTAMALQALSKYKGMDDTVDESIEKTLSYLQSQMNASYGFGNDSEATSQVLMSLTSLGINPIDAAYGFGTKYSNIFTFLDGFYCEDTSGFSHEMGGKTNMMATLQVLQAYTSYNLYKEGIGSYWDLTDAEKPSDSENAEEGNSDNSNNDGSHGTGDNSQGSTDESTGEGTGDAVQKPSNGSADNTSSNAGIQNGGASGTQSGNSQDAHSNANNMNSVTVSVSQGQLQGMSQSSHSDKTDALLNDSKDNSHEEVKDDKEDKKEGGWTFAGDDYVEESDKKSDNEEGNLVNVSGKINIGIIAVVIALAAAGAGIIVKKRNTVKREE